MFHHITKEILMRMEYLHARDQEEMLEKINQKHFDKLRQIPPETGKFISLIAASAPLGKWLEIGTSGGYSTLWLTLACKYLQTKIITFELDPDKIKLAKETFGVSQVEQYVDLIEGNVFDYLDSYKDVSFCFLDTEKELYGDCYETVMQNMVPGGILLADNVISHKNDLQPFIDHVLLDSRIDSLVVPVGQGVLMCRKL